MIKMEVNDKASVLPIDIDTGINLKAAFSKPAAELQPMIVIGNKNLKVRFKSTPDTVSSDFDIYKEISIKDYNRLYNKPSVNGNTIQGDMQAADFGVILQNTVEGWNSEKNLISEQGVLYVYMDYITTDNGDGTYTVTPGMKVGDGSSYLIDMPFTGTGDPRIAQHVADMTMHITEEERMFWNSKWRGYTISQSPETLIFTTN